MNTFTPEYNVYADKTGAATHDPADGKNTIVIAAGSPISEDEAKRLKLPELEAATRAKIDAARAKTALKPAEISATDAKRIEKAAQSDAPATAQVTVPETAPQAAQGAK
ncbi:MAG: hypothetical protein KY445_04715 [Armatimonadetes bacterium]|nr:hypothetical protein [Armatimonadota bacterium]